MYILQIRIEAITDGLKAALILRRMHAETALDQVAGDPVYVMRVVADWLEQTNNLTTTKNV